jgi:hypothetical protein
MSCFIVIFFRFLILLPNSIIEPKLIALDNVWKADQPALGNRALTFPRVKEKYWSRLQCYQHVTICIKLMETSLSCGARSVIFASMEKQEDKVGVAAQAPVSF